MAKTSDAAKAQQDLVETASEPKDDDLKCVNHPRRQARRFTANGAIDVALCDECTPSWFKE